jgi:hypothetical protein
VLHLDNNGHWKEDVKHFEEGNIVAREAHRYFGVPPATPNMSWISDDLTERKLDPPGRHLSSLTTGLQKALTATSRLMTCYKYSIRCGLRPLWSGN